MAPTLRSMKVTTEEVRRGKGGGWSPRQKVNCLKTKRVIGEREAKTKNDTGSNQV